MHQRHWVGFWFVRRKWVVMGGGLHRKSGKKNLLGMASLKWVEAFIENQEKKLLGIMEGCGCGIGVKREENRHNS